MELTDRQIDLMKIISMIILSITIAFVGFIMFKYGNIIKEDPCSICNKNSFDLIKELLK